MAACFHNLRMADRFRGSNDRVESRCSQCIAWDCIIFAGNEKRFVSIDRSNDALLFVGFR